MHPRRTALLAVVVVVLAFLTIRAFRARRDETAGYTSLGTAAQKNASESERELDRRGGARKPRADGGRSAIGIGAQD